MALNTPMQGGFQAQKAMQSSKYLGNWKLKLVIPRVLFSKFKKGFHSPDILRKLLRNISHNFLSLHLT